MDDLIAETAEDIVHETGGLQDSLPRVRALLEKLVAEEGKRILAEMKGECYETDEKTS